MVDFSALNRKPVGEAKKPQHLPMGDYMGVVKGFEVTENKFVNPPQPIIQLMVGLLDWPDSVDQEDRMQDGTLIDLSKRQLRKNYRFNAQNPGVDDDLWRVDELLKDLQINGAGRGYQEVLPELTGQRVLVEVQVYMNQNTNEPGNNVGKLKPLG